MGSVHYHSGPTWTLTIDEPSANSRAGASPPCQNSCGRFYPPNSLQLYACNAFRINEDFFFVPLSRKRRLILLAGFNTRGAAWAPGQRDLPVIKGSEIDGIISRHCPRPPLPVIVCQALKNFKNCLECIAGGTFPFFSRVFKAPPPSLSARLI